MSDASTPPLHPQTKAFLSATALNPRPAWWEMSLGEARAVFDTFNDAGGQAPELMTVSDVTLACGVPVRVYRPANAIDVLGVVYFHGGGWVLGSPDSHDALCRRLADESGAVVFSVHYRRAPETPFPGPLNDCYAATCELASRGAEFGIADEQLVLAGDSAGGNLAVAVAVRARDEQGPQITRQMLIYPVVSPNVETASYHTYAEGYGLTRAMMQWFWQCYVGDEFTTKKHTNGDATSGMFDLLKQPALKGLPPTDIVLATHDVLYDEGRTLASRLRDSGVETTVHEYAGMIHGFVHIAGCFDDGLAATSLLAERIRHAVAS